MPCLPEVPLEVVARHLRDQALVLKGTGEGALFGRSAFNRFYYSAYLLTKQHLLPVFPGLPGKHADLPNYLRGSVAKELNRRKNQARRVEDQTTLMLVQGARKAAIELADLLTVGYSARVVADYEPEVDVNFYDHGFALNEVRVTEAESWPHKAKQFALLVGNAMRQTNEY